jgi:lycopene beta-cyclase
MWLSNSAEWPKSKPVGLHTHEAKTAGLAMAGSVMAGSAKIVSEKHGDASVDVVVIGDGPAGSALALACTAAGLDTLLIGDDAAWGNPYGTWIDDLYAVDLLVGHDVLGAGPFDVVAWSDRRHDLGRAYGMLDNAALRAVLRAGVTHRCGRAAFVRTASGRHTVELESGDQLSCRLVVDAAGWPAAFADRVTGSSLPAWQTAFGVVLPEPPAGDLGQPTVMDFRSPSEQHVAAEYSTFVYCLPVADGWLVEETVLAARPAVDPQELVLAARLGTDPDALLSAAVRTEVVRIPMGGARPRRDQPIVAFGAAAGYVNPTSGYSVVHSMSMATPVAAAIAAVMASSPDNEVADSLPVWNAVWPVAHRRTRTLHDYGLDMLTRLNADQTRQFFGEFFELPSEVWPKYMRPGTPPAELSAVMARLFIQAPWSIRRRLMMGNPKAFAQLLRPS